jgi:putative transposase
LLTEANGIQIGLSIAGVNRHDSKMAEATLESIPVPRPDPTAKEPQGICLDKAYDYGEVRALVKKSFLIPHTFAYMVKKPRAIKRQVGFKACRCVTERTHSQMNRFRCILIRWEKKPENYFSLFHFVCAIITFRCSGSFG